MRRRDFVGGGILATSSSLAAAAPTAPTRDVQLVKLRFTPGGRSIWQDWATELKQRESEVIATMRNEGVRSEACFISQDGEHVYYFMESADAAKAAAKFATSSNPIDAEHKAKLKLSLVLVEQMSVMFAFQRG